MPATRTAPRAVDPWKHASDFQAALLAEFGFSTRKIVADTHLTPSQISYRLKKFGIKRRDYRDGDSLGAQAVIRVASREIGRPLSTELHNRLKGGR
jgi:hypothetical protein